MKHVNGKKIETIIEIIFKLFEDHNITPNEASSIAGMIISNSAIASSASQLRILLDEMKANVEILADLMPKERK